jgi:peptide/nickel transport system ATP-binding protein
VSLLEVRDLSTHFQVKAGPLRAVDHVSFTIEPGEVLGLVGESGSGKSVTALSILRLVDVPGRIVGGEVLFDGEDLLGLDDREMLAVRGQKIAMIFQEPMTSLNPVLTVGTQIVEALDREYYDKWRRGVAFGIAGALGRTFRRNGRARREREARAIELLRSVHLPDAENRLREYPYMMSGGMIQRIMIAIALAGGPSLLIADEPTTALDVTIQAQILDLLRSRQRDAQLAVLLITHDLGVVAESCDRVAVMYAGRIVETAPAVQLFDYPRHPYTIGLRRSMPDPDRKIERLTAIEGSVPSLVGLPESQCHFQARCPFVMDICRRVAPEPVTIGQGHVVRCHLYGDGKPLPDLTTTRVPTAVAAADVGRLPSPVPVSS